MHVPLWRIAIGALFAFAKGVPPPFLSSGTEIAPFLHAFFQDFPKPSFVIESFFVVENLYAWAF